MYRRCHRGDCVSLFINSVDHRCCELCQTDDDTEQGVCRVRHTGYTSKNVRRAGPVWKRVVKLKDDRPLNFEKILRYTVGTIRHNDNTSFRDMKNFVPS